ncbi:MAG: cob(I)yrinic acid a,c-diamide adenosyltransferase [Clostridiales bacterium]|jgi:cob(I)alamin adenosyltransferase|nr:cob(I)yrinic acid a,c-diamide adenosyltransferase [Clostridiales bacterium]
MGLIHIYTGDGKGKSTAALGLALRAAGRKKQVVIAQFLKGGDTGELYTLAHIPNITLMRNSRDYGFFHTLDDADKQAVYRENTQNLLTACELAQKGQCDMLILDEIWPAYNLRAVDTQAMERLLAEKKTAPELVLTGRDAPASFIEKADYVTNMQCAKHPFTRGIAAREGIEY